MVIQVIIFGHRYVEALGYSDHGSEKTLIHALLCQYKTVGIVLDLVWRRDPALHPGFV